MKWYYERMRRRAGLVPARMVANNEEQALMAMEALGLDTTGDVTDQDGAPVEQAGPCYRGPVHYHGSGDLWAVMDDWGAVMYSGSGPLLVIKWAANA